MQHESLFAFAPLFSVAGKLNYTSSVAFYLAHLAKNSELKELLKHVCSINISREKHFFAFDKALETLGVKYIKQNISENSINIDQLKNQIKAVQNDNVAHQDNSLFKDISELSNMTAEYTSEGWTRLFNCYLIGEERLNVILQQDILKREKR
ncbi:hypothetical protein RhiirA4_471550, partial [Rhizophagus irregularis]